MRGEDAVDGGVGGEGLAEGGGDGVEGAEAGGGDGEEGGGFLGGGLVWGWDGGDGGLTLRGRVATRPMPRPGICWGEMPRSSMPWSMAQRRRVS